MCVGARLQIASVILTEVKQQQKQLAANGLSGTASGTEFSSKYNLKHLAPTETVLLSFLCWESPDLLDLSCLVMLTFRHTPIFCYIR